MAEKWIAVWPMPNLNLSGSILSQNGGLLHGDDERLSSIADQREPVRKLLGGFKNEFGVRRKPGIMAFRAEAPKAVKSIDALGALRDAICVSALTRSHAMFLLRGQSLEPYYSDVFDFYPWHLAAKREGDDPIRIFADTPGMSGIHSLEKLTPQTSPATAHHVFGPDDLDQPLLTAILSRWERHFATASDEPELTDRRLFRSLDMARSALRMPGGPDASIFHVGRSIAMWVSAFETLTPDRKSAARKVVELLAAANLQSEELVLPKWPVKFSGKEEKVGLPGALYMRLYGARNDFLHGNEIADDLLDFIPDGRRITHYCAPLYRLALTSFLNLSYRQPMPQKETDPRGWSKWLSDRMEYMSPQKRIERALLTATKPIDEDDDE